MWGGEFALEQQTLFSGTNMTTIICDSPQETTNHPPHGLPAGEPALVILFNCLPLISLRAQPVVGTPSSQGTNVWAGPSSPPPTSRCRPTRPRAMGIPSTALPWALQGTPSHVAEFYHSSVPLPIVLTPS